MSVSDRVRSCRPVRFFPTASEGGTADRLVRAGALQRALMLAVFVVTGVTTAAAQTATVRGTVRDGRTGEPLPRVTVRLDGIGHTTTADETGRYVFAEVPPGEHTLRFNLIGYTPATLTLYVAAGAEEVQDVALAVKAVRLRPVTVIHDRTRLVGAARLAEIPGSAHVLDRLKVEDPKAVFGDVHALLGEVPGVNVQEEEGYGLRPNIGLRGTGVERSSKITLMEDGVLIAPAPYAAPAAYYFPVVGRMEAIEVRKGSSQIKYGPRTVGGALNLVSTSIPDELTLYGEVAAGQDATRKLRARIGNAYRNFGWLLEGYQIRTNGFKRLDGTGDTGFDIEDYLLKLRVNTDPGAAVYQEMEIKLGHTDELSNETYLGLTDGDFQRSALRRYAASQRDVMDAEHQQVQLRHFIRPADWLDVTSTVYRNDFARNWYKLQSVYQERLADILDRPSEFPAELTVLRGADSDPDALRVRANNRDYYAQGMQSFIGLRFGGAAQNELELGIRYHEDREDRFQHEDGFQMLNGSLVLTSEGAPGSQSNRVSDARAWAFYVQHRITLGQLSVAPGVRYEHAAFRRTDYGGDDPNRIAPTRVRENDVAVWIPGVGVRYGVAAGVSVFGGVHKGFAPPGPGAAPETKPEESVNYEVGARLVRNGVNAQVVGFFSDYENIVGRATLATGETGTGEQFNGGAMDVAGLEMSVEVDALTMWSKALSLPLQLSYTFTRATFQTDFDSDFEPWGTVLVGDHLPYLPEHRLYLGAGIRHRNWGASLSARYSGEMRTVAGQGPIPPGRAADAALVLNGAAEYTFMSESVVFVAVQNLANEQHVVARRPAGARPGLPRTILAGIRFGR